MPIDDPNTWMQGATAVKAAFDAFKSAVGMVREIRKATGGSPEQAKALDAALDHAVSAAAIAEAEVAKALGYELCKCQFPPTIMVTVGHKSARHKNAVGPVYECPKCGFNTAAPFDFTRTAPPPMG
jgi:hypothetical protein